MRSQETFELSNTAFRRVGILLPHPPTKQYDIF